MCGLLSAPTFPRFPGQPSRCLEPGCSNTPRRSTRRCYGQRQTYVLVVALRCCQCSVRGCQWSESLALQMARRPVDPSPRRAQHFKFSLLPSTCTVNQTLVRCVALGLRSRSTTGTFSISAIRWRSAAGSGCLGIHGPSRCQTRPRSVPKTTRVSMRVCSSASSSSHVVQGHCSILGPGYAQLFSIFASGSQRSSFQLSAGSHKSAAAQTELAQQLAVRSHVFLSLSGV